ncbi:MAG: glycosyltransferase family 9 protein [Acidobacteriia bacterium]|nr:glycosyltransferase family 9 protein [Terriglobia bacterium]
MNRILLVRLGALGDIVHAIPVAAALRRAFPAARIDWLVSAKHRAILDLVPIIDRRLVLGTGDLGTGLGILRRRDPSPGYRDLSPGWLAAIRELRQSRYDVAIDLQGLIKSAVLARSSGAARVIGFSSRYAREGLARWFYTEAVDPGRGGLFDAGETRHVVELNLLLLGPLGVTVGKPEFPIEPVDSDVARWASEQSKGRYALVNPGAAWPNKRWPPARLAAVASALRDRHGLTSIVLWGPGEESLAQEVVAGSHGAAVLSPKTTIGDLVALSRGAALMISGDTGPTHIASAVGTPLVGIFGPTRPARNGPLSPLDVAVSRDDICKCHHRRRCTLDRMCLLDIEVDEVLSAVERRLAAGRDRG